MQDLGLEQVEMQSFVYEMNYTPSSDKEMNNSKEQKPSTPKRVEGKEYNFKAVRNNQVYQQAIFIWLLNSHFDITIKTPLKKANVFEQILRVDKIKSESDEIFMNEVVERRIKTIFVHDIKNGVSEKTGIRRTENNRITEGLHLMIDILREMGYFFNSKIGNGKKGTVKTETVEAVFLSNKVIITRNDIQAKGKLINSKICELMENKPSITIPRGSLAQLLSC